MSLKELLTDYINDRNTADSFNRDPEAVFERYSVDRGLRAALAARDANVLRSTVDESTMELLLEAYKLRPAVTILYPAAQLRIRDVRPKHLRAGQAVELLVEVGWDHEEIPSLGLPRFGFLHIDDPNGVPTELTTVPIFVDLLTRTIKLREWFTFPVAGDYYLWVNLEGYDTIHTDQRRLEVAPPR